MKRALLISLLAGSSVFAQQKPLQISGVYPHLAVFNRGDGIPCKGNGGECGIGAVVPWAGKLWMVTYSPHCPGGSSDKLYTIDNNLELTIRPESVGGTPANRMIHRESNQLIIGPYFVSKEGAVRTIPQTVMPGRLTATARHLTDPANQVYFYDMEGMLYEANVHSLAVKKLFHKPVPGWHGKGGYTAQGRLVVANNGEHQVFDIDTKQLQAGAAPKNKDEMGVLAEWDGKAWSIVERKQFTDVTGPGGIYGAPSPESPAWSIGWDRRSVILKLLDHGKWHTYRLPKSTHTYDHWGGWYTEWPRIREIGNNRLLMDMHGMFYDFPAGFSAGKTGGIRPISNHLRYIPDFCSWNGQLVLATDETSILENPLAGRSQSNLWFGQPEQLREWGAANGWGGPWQNDAVQAGEASDPFLINGFGKKILHLTHQNGKAVTFTLEVDKTGTGRWENYATVSVPKEGYLAYAFPSSFSATWIRLIAGQSGTYSAFFHYQGQGHAASDGKALFAGLADATDRDAVAAIIRPAKDNTNLQVLNGTVYQEVDETLSYLTPAGSKAEEVAAVGAFKKDFELDDASVIVKDATGTFRLPRTLAAYDQPFAAGWPRGRREVESERYLFQAHGTIYEVPREGGFATMRPITTHRKQIQDFCTWRGLLVLSGTKKGAENREHIFGSGMTSLWFGAIDDLWKLGKPTGEGGVWKNTAVRAGEPSLPYLMTGYDKKTVTLSSDKDAVFTLEVDFDHVSGWHTYKRIAVKAGKPVTVTFPDTFNAHWLRVTSDTDCVGTAWVVYE
jgi:hypothetical protein